jgi:hypothetical protein
MTVIYNDEIYGIKITVTDGKMNYTSPQYGTDPSTTQQTYKYQFGKEETYINKVEYELKSNRVYGFRFHSRDGKVTERIGGIGVLNYIEPFP